MLRLFCWKEFLRFRLYQKVKQVSSLIGDGHSFLLRFHQKQHLKVFLRLQKEL